VGAAAFVGMSYYGLENHEGENDQENVSKKDSVHMEQTNNPDTEEESMEELVRRVIQEDIHHQRRNNRVNETESATETPQSHERFQAEIPGYEALTKLRKDEVLFLNENNEPVGQPQKFQEFIDSKVKSDGSVMNRYLYAPGTLNEAGFPEAGIAGEWVDYVQAIVQAEHPEQEIAQRRNVVVDFSAAYSESDEPELVAGIASGDIDSYDDIVSYFAEKPVRGAEYLNRMQYGQQHIEFRSEDEVGRPAVPETIQAEFKRILPGLFAHESKFNAGLTSSTGARGLAQIMPQTWKEYRGDTEVSLGLVEQLDVAGRFISDNYHYITHYAEGALPILRERFDTDQAFETELIVPLMISAYNVGGPAIGLLVSEFVTQTPKEELLTGKDLFLQFRDFAQSSDKGREFYFGEEAGKYVPSVYGNVAMLEEKYPQSYSQ